MLAHLEILDSVKMSTVPTDETSHAARSERLKRRLNRRTKTGRKACRTKRVKCDEQKLSCQRRKTFGVDCDG